MMTMPNLRRAMGIAVAVVVLVVCGQKTSSGAPHGVLMTGQAKAADAALARYVSKARQGDAEAQIVLARAYCKKGRLPGDLQALNLSDRKDIPSPALCNRGIRDLGALADKGNLEAQVELANFYNSALRVDDEDVLAPDDRTALQWYLAIANRPTPPALSLGNNPPPQNIPPEISAAAWAGKFYEDGLGTDKNPAKAFHWIRLAAELGYDPAVIEVARLYRLGLGTPKDPKTARDWLKTLPNNVTAQLDLAELYMFEGNKLRDAGTKAFHILALFSQNDQIDIVQRRAVAYDLGQLYLNGIGTGKDYKKAAHYLLEAAREGEPHAQYLIAYLYREGLGVLQDNEEAFVWATLAASNGDQQGQTLRDSIGYGFSHAQLTRARVHAKAWGSGKNLIIYDCKTPRFGNEEFRIDLDNYRVTRVAGSVSTSDFQATDSGEGYKILSASMRTTGLGPFEISTDSGEFESRANGSADHGSCIKEATRAGASR